MKEAMPQVIGNEKLRNRLCGDIRGGTCAHAYILAGAHGSGKHTIAYNFIAAVACENKADRSEPLPCGHCQMCRKIFSGKCPDVTLISKTGASVKIDQIREMKNDVPVLPNDLDDKFYIIEDADTMTPAAQNAFLLTLEEPPAFVHFFLLCEKPEKLLETVRSRAPVLRTEFLSDERIRQYVIGRVPAARTLMETAPREFDGILSIAGGSLGRVIELTDSKEREPLMRCRVIADELLRNAIGKNGTALIEQILSLPPKQDELLPILGAVQNALRDLIALKTDESAPLLFYTDRNAALTLAYSESLKTFCDLYETFAGTSARISRNANIRLSLTAMLSKI